MKKTFGIYSIVWIICLAVFNVVCFVSPSEAGGMNKFGGAFWVGYIFITVAFVGQLASAFFAFKADSNQKLFYNISLISVSYAGLIAMLIVGAVCMAIPDLPNWIGIIVCLLVAVFTAISAVKASAAISAVSGTDQRIKAKTYFIKSLTVDAEHLMNKSNDGDFKALTKKVYEAIRFSDPMSNAVLVEVEEKIGNGFSDFENAVCGEDYELASSTADELLSLIDIRNKKCKLLK